MFEFNFDDLFNDLHPFNWDKDSYKFNRDEKDMHPYSIIKNKDNIIIVHNICGIDKKDLKISFSSVERKNEIEIIGKTVDEITKKEYSISSKFALDDSQLDLEKITSTAKNGLLYITIGIKEEKKKLNSKRIININ